MAAPVRGYLYKFFAPVFLTILVFVVFRGSLDFFFAQDDFVWLRIAASVKDASDLFGFFVQYNGAGNYRPLTQEIFFFLGYKLFGLNPVPFHAMALGIHAVNSLLVYGIMRQMSLPRMASLVGAIFYALNSSVFIPVYWVSAVSESGMAIFYLSSVLFFLRYLQGDGRVDYGLSFLAGLLALMSKEPAITIPAILLLIYCYQCNSLTLASLIRGIRLVSPFAVVVAFYLAIRFVTLGFEGSGPYKPEFNFMIVNNLWAYFKWALNDLDTTLLHLNRATEYRFTLAFQIAHIVLLVGVALFLLLKERRVFLFSLLWFVIALIPVLPYVHHAQNYYVNVAVVGISVLLGTIVAKYGERARLLVGVLVAVYIFSSILNVRYQENYSWVAVRSKIAETDLAEVKSLYPTLPRNATIYLLNTDENDYWAYNFGDIFRVFYYNEAMKFIFEDRKEEQSGIEDMDDLYVFFKFGGRLYDVTAQFERIRDAKELYEHRFDLIPFESTQLSNVIDFSQSDGENQLVDGWHGPESGGYRWMTKKSEIMLRNDKADHKDKLRLLVKGSAVLDHYPSKELAMVIKINESEIAREVIKKSGEYFIEAEFSGNYPKVVLIELEVDKTFRPSEEMGSSDTRELGVTVSRVELW